MEKKWYVFNVEPATAPRQVKSDTWRPRPIVLRYRRFKDEFNLLLKTQGLDLSKHSVLSLHFEIAMPASWRQEKRDKMWKTPHQNMPDLDNLCKSVLDASGINDCHVHSLELSKVWSDKSKILIGVWE